MGGSHPTPGTCPSDLQSTRCVGDRSDVSVAQLTGLNTFSWRRQSSRLTPNDIPQQEQPGGRLWSSSGPLPLDIAAQEGVRLTAASHHLLAPGPTLLAP